MKAQVTQTGSVFDYETSKNIIQDLFEVKHETYFLDLILSGIGGWVIFLTALHFSWGSSKILMLLISALLFYRGLTLIHPIIHLNSTKSGKIRLLHYLLIGCPFLIPLFFYENSHRVHHQRNTYGTANDGEYIPFAHKHPFRIIVFILSSLLFPFILTLRYGLVGPLSFVRSSWRTTVETRFSSAAMNPSFRIDRPTGKTRREWLVQELGCTSIVLLSVFLLILHVISPGFFLQYFLIASGMALLNTVQGLTLHRYQSDGTSTDTNGIILDSYNTPGRFPLLTELWAPVGQRFHALHHLFPLLPYHNMATAHRRLMKLLPANSVYHQTENGSLFSALSALFISTLNRMRMGLAYVAIAKDFNRTDKIFQLTDLGMNSPNKALVQVLLDRAFADEGFASLYNEEFHPELPQTDQLLLYPSASLGYELGCHLKTHHLKSDFYPRIPMKDARSYIGLRMRQTHDIWHVLLGYGITTHDEIAIQAFALGQLKTGLPAVLISAGILNILRDSPKEIEKLMDSILFEFKRGKEAKFLLGIPWERLLNEPIVELRNKVGLTHNAYPCI